ncbi:adenylate kinase family protein [Halobaculum roseum]|uniref:Putative adenylate kinase n=1 Tax=Halobaculum roseum TaxID=2175149 RepID=A0ABD5MPF7_9EURY|nr:adenylate kinase family protein [Halobaculum roseum]QZY03171.1 adenylate kinase family protein [Halobaculum roseum]
MTGGGPVDRLAVTGTPGTGKTTATDLLAAERGIEVVHLNDVIREEGLYVERDEERDSLVADLDAVAEHLGDWSGVVDSHLAHYLDADRVAVLRCRPDVLERRLIERGESEASARENRESEALDVILGEAVDRFGEDQVYEIDTTDRDPERVATELGRVLDGDREPSAGEVDFVEYL